MKNFWLTLKKPILVLAPMEDVTDFVFRKIITEIAKPDVLFTEFTNCDGLISAGSTVVKQRLKYDEDQRPLVAQIWGKNPETYFKSAQLIKGLGFDGIDINMGCPAKKVVKDNNGAGLIKDPKLAGEIILAVKEGGGLPVSVKTRLGYRSVQTQDWLGYLLSLDLAALTVHGRIATHLSKDPANWEEIGRVVKMRNEAKIRTLIIGNGDVKSYSDALEKYNQYKVDGVMIGRGIFENPWLFEKTLDPKHHTLNERVDLMLKHAELFEKTWQNPKRFGVMKKFIKMYINGFEGAGDIRAKLMTADNYADLQKLLINLAS
jgi:nifR3 family TIM-barrel protein